MEEVIIYVTLLFLLAATAYLLKKRNGKTTPDHPDGNAAYPNIPKSKDGAEYDTAVLLAILREQLNHSREDVTALQDAVEELTTQIAGLRTDTLMHLISYSKEAKVDIGRVEIELGKINNRLDNYRLIISRIEENTR